MKQIAQINVQGYEQKPVYQVPLHIFKNSSRLRKYPLIIQTGRSFWDIGIRPDDNLSGLRLTQDNIDELIKILVNVRVELENGNSK